MDTKNSEPTFAEEERLDSQVGNHEPFEASGPGVEIN